ncbi:MAG TPA: ADP-ribosylglycohydrolase family protein [Chloroflexota bacterium]|nr:ADP-ribosylglycohydrolase family protein [Chloroflexota bacterium]
MALPPDYAERVYAGVLGKIIGVYLGRPFEGWTHERIMAELGEITYYVHGRQDAPIKNRVLVITDDDISGTFTFLRALPDYGNSRELTPAQIGQTWLNYIIERRTILWWGGLGNSTEHTAYLRLQSGIPAPRSGSLELNGAEVAEQIGAQIFIDGWAMVAPGDPELAADLARRAASVSHDGAAIHGAQIVAAMEAQAFVEPDINALIDTALRFIPADSIIRRLIHDIREWHAQHPGDWRATRARIAERYGYDRYPGNCHMVPNHALIIHALLHGDGDFQQSLMIANTSGWDTDCNSGNVGCLLGIKDGLAGIEAGPDWRGPVADRLYLPTADGGRAITDAVTEAYHIVNVGRALAGEASLAPKGGARFHFELPGAVQGFQPEDGADSHGTVRVENVEGHSTDGQRSLALRYRHLALGRVARVSTPTFIPPEALTIPGYALVASPTLYPGQVVSARLLADSANNEPVTAALYLQTYGAGDALARVPGPEAQLAPGVHHDYRWRVPDTGGAPIAAVGVELRTTRRADGVVYLDYLTWEGAPDMALLRPADGGTLWRRAWVDAVDQVDFRRPDPYRLMQNHGTGMLIQGTREWTEYRVSAAITPHLVEAAGLGARVQGVRRYYALLLHRTGTVRLVKALDGARVLAEAAFAWMFGATYQLSLQLTGTRIQAWIDDELFFDIVDGDRPLTGGGIALIAVEGRLSADSVCVRPSSSG